MLLLLLYRHHHTQADDQLRAVLDVCESMSHHLTAAVVSNDINFLQVSRHTEFERSVWQRLWQGEKGGSCAWVGKMCACWRGWSCLM
jgi:hypothetical protein